MEKIVFLNETKKTAGVRNEICKEYISEEGSVSDGTNHFYRAKEGILRKVSSACCRTKPATISMVIG